MSHFVTFCFEIKEIVGGRVHLDRHTFLYLKTETAESVDFFWPGSFRMPYRRRFRLAEM